MINVSGGLGIWGGLLVIKMKKSPATEPAVLACSYPIKSLTEVPCTANRTSARVKMHPSFPKCPLMLCYPMSMSRYESMLSYANGLMVYYIY